MRDRLGDLKGNTPHAEPAAEEEKPKTEKEEKKEKKEKKKEEAALEKKGKGGKDDKQSSGGDGGDSEEMKAFFEEVASMRDQIAFIKSSIDQIEKAHQNAMNTISEEQAAENTKELERLMSVTNKQSSEVRNKLKAMEAANKKLLKTPGSSADARIRITQHGVVTKKFLDVMMEYKDVQKKYQEKYKQQMQRQFLIVNPAASPEEIDKMLTSGGESGPVFAQSIVQNGQKAEAKRALQDIKDRHADVQRIEKSIIEMQQLFIDMSVLVSAQAELLNHIEINVNDAVEQTDQGVEHLKGATKLQKKTRKKMCIIIGLLVGVMLIVFIGIYFGILKK
ncbi:Syntaxin-1A [Phlyctochytrium planicorne]|nr:Syntaxin-1A [Phlyctochytrium planicorne]